MSDAPEVQAAIETVSEQVRHERDELGRSHIELIEIHLLELILADHAALAGRLAESEQFGDSFEKINDKLLELNGRIIADMKAKLEPLPGCGHPRMFFVEGTPGQYADAEGTDWIDEVPGHCSLCRQVEDAVARAWNDALAVTNMNNCRDGILYAMHERGIPISPQGHAPASQSQVPEGTVGDLDRVTALTESATIAGAAVPEGKVAPASPATNGGCADE